MDQVFPVVHARESARAEVEKLHHSSVRSKVLKQRCQEVAGAGWGVLSQLEQAMQSRSLDQGALIVAGARLSLLAKNARETVESVGTAGSIAARLAATFQRKVAERRLIRDASLLQQLSSSLSSSISGTAAPGYAPNAPNPDSALRMMPSSRGADLGIMDRGLGWGGLATRDAPPLSPTSSTAHNRTLNLQSSPLGPSVRPSPAPSQRIRLRGGGGAADAVVSPGGSCGEDAESQGLPFAQRTVRASDNNPVQRVCFMRGAGGGAGGESAAVQLMVVLPKQNEIYSAALDSFHSDTPMDWEGQQVTSSALYEPTIDLITGHRCGSVLVYGRVGLGPSAAPIGSPRTAAAAASAASLAGLPLVIRLSRQAVTALHCVPAIELEATTRRNGSGGANNATAGGAAGAAAEGGEAAGAAAGGADGAAGAVGGAAAGSGGLTAAQVPLGSCTIDDVLLFTGDAAGRVMAVRYSRVEPEVLAATVFTAARRQNGSKGGGGESNGGASGAAGGGNGGGSGNPSTLAGAQSTGGAAGGSGGSASNGGGGSAPNGAAGGGSISNSGGGYDNVQTPEITGLLYRSGYLVISTSNDSMYSVRVTCNGIALLPAPSTGGGAASGAAGAGGPPGGPSTIPEEGGDKVGPLAWPTVNTPRPGTLPSSTSVTLLSPTASAMPGKSGTLARQMTTENSSTGAGAGAGAGGSGTAAAGGSSTALDSTIRKGTLQLATAVVDSFSFAGFGSCTAMVALDWGPPPDADLASGSTSVVAPATPPAAASSFCDIAAAADVGGAGPGAAGRHFFSGPDSGMWGAQPYNNNNANSALPAVSVSLPGYTTPAAAAMGGSGRVIPPRRCPWRMLSAHTNGQLLMWDLSSGRLQLICAIGEQGPSIISAFLFPELGTMVELQSSGHIRVGPLPTASLAPPINPLGGVPVWRIRQARLRAHQGRITAGAALMNCIATGSKAGGVKVWSAMDLRRRAMAQGVSFLLPASASWGAASSVVSSVAGSGIPGIGGGIPGGVSAAVTAAGSPTISTRSPLWAPFPLPGGMPGPGRGGGPGGGGGLGGGLCGGPGAGSEDRYPLGTGGGAGGALGPPAPSMSGPLMGGPSSQQSLHGHGCGPQQYPPPGASSAFQPHPYLRLNSERGGSMNSLGPGAIPLPPMGIAPPPPPVDAICTLPVQMYGPPSGMATPYGMSGGGAGPGPSSTSMHQHVPGPTGPDSHLGGLPAAMAPVSHAAPSTVGGGPGDGVNSAVVSTVGPLDSPAQSLNANTIPVGGAGTGGGGHGGMGDDGEPSRDSSFANPPGAGGKGGAAARHGTQADRAGPPNRTDGRVGALGNDSQSRPTSMQKIPPNPPPNNTLAAVQKAFDQMGHAQNGHAAADGGDSSQKLRDAKLPLIPPVGDEADAPAGGGGGGAMPSMSSGELSNRPTGSNNVTGRAAQQQQQQQQQQARLGRSDTAGRPMSPGPAGPAVGGLPGSAVGPMMVPLSGAGLGGGLYGNGGPPGSGNYPHIGGSNWQPAAYNVVQQQPQAWPPAPVAMYVSGLVADYPMRGSEYGTLIQHVPGPQPPMSPRAPQRSFERRLSTMSDYNPCGPMDPEPSYAEFLPLPPVRPPPTPDPAAQMSAPLQINPLLQNVFIQPDDLRLIDPVGQGAEGTVWRGRWHHIDVAVKEMHPTTPSFEQLVSIAKDLSCPDSAGKSEVLASVVKEVTALIDLSQHPNIIRFVGVCIAPPRIITEYYAMGSLFSMLKQARQGNMRTREKLTWMQRLIMLQDIAAGMAYLHSRNYIHGDLRSPNVFVTSDQHLKIGDFGFARILSNAQESGQGVPARLTNPRWQAPEVYAMSVPTATTAADVYSFGIIMYEMLTFHQPYDDVADDGMVMCRHTLYPEWRPNLPDDRKLPVPPNIHLQAYKALMMDCWAVDPVDRPEFHKIAERLMALIRWQRILSVVRQSIMGARMMRPPSPRPGPAAAGAIAAGATVAVLPPDTAAVATTAIVAAATEGAPATEGGLRDALTALVEKLQDDPALERDLMAEINKATTPTAAAAAKATGAGGATGPSLTSQGSVRSPAAPIAIASLSPVATASIASASVSASMTSGAATGVSTPAGTAAAAARTFPAAGAAGSRVASPASGAEPPTLETAPTLTSRPLTVTAASVPVPPPPLHTSPSMTATSTSTRPLRRISTAKPTAPVVLGPAPDGFGLVSPFKGVSALSDEEEEEEGEAALELPNPPAAAATAVRSASQPPAGATAAAASAASTSAPAVVLGGGSTATATASSIVAAPLMAALSAPAADPFVMLSPFNAIGDLDDSDDEPHGRTAAAPVVPVDVTPPPPLKTTKPPPPARPPPALISRLSAAVAEAPGGSPGNGTATMATASRSPAPPPPAPFGQQTSVSAGSPPASLTNLPSVALMANGTGNGMSAGSTAAAQPATALSSATSVALPTPPMLATATSVAMRPTAAAAPTATAAPAAPAPSPGLPVVEGALSAPMPGGAGSRYAVPDEPPAPMRAMSLGPSAHDPFTMLSPFHNISLDEEDE